jgi:hypothetical protein
VAVLKTLAYRHTEIQVPYLRGEVRTHVFYSVALSCGKVIPASVLLGTDHYALLRFAFIATDILRSELAFISLIGLPVTSEIVNEVFSTLLKNRCVRCLGDGRRLPGPLHLRLP